MARQMTVEKNAVFSEYKYERPYTSSVNRYLKLPRFSVRWMCQSGLTDRISVNGGTRTAVSAKLMTNANPKGMRKKINRKSSGGKIMSHFPWRFSQSPRGARGEADAEVSVWP